MTNSEASEKEKEREEAPKVFHPAYTFYVVPPDPLQPSPRRPRAVHSAQPAPISYALLRRQSFFVLKRSLDDPNRDNIVVGKTNLCVNINKILSSSQQNNNVVGKATMPGSNLAAYAREPLDVDDVVGVFSVPSQTSSADILPSESSKNKDYAMSIKDPESEKVYTVNPYFAASCHARFIDEALTEDEENCVFAIRKGRIIVLATKRIEAGAQLLSRYGHEYWLKRIDYIPCELANTMFLKYSSTLKQKEIQDWRRALKRKAPEIRPESQSSPRRIIVSKAKGITKKAEPVQVVNNTFLNNMFTSSSSY